RSLGFWLRYGAFRFVDLGDLDWNKLTRLVCPINRLGTADVYLVPHHGNSDTNIPAALSALRPRVAVLNNGVVQGGSADTFASLHRDTAIQGVWQLHRSANPGAENFDDAFIANVDAGTTGYWIKVAATADGTFTMTNSRNRVSRTYRARRANE